MKASLKIISGILFTLLLVGCEISSPAKLSVNYIDFTEISRSKVLDLPLGSYNPDNPDFDVDNPTTWTGNMAQYVTYDYIYFIAYEIENLGYQTAYDAEVELHYYYDDGSEFIEIISIGDLEPNFIIEFTANSASTNKQLIECSCEAFWYE